MQTEKKAETIAANPANGPENKTEPRRRLLILDLDGTLWGGHAAFGIIFGSRDGRVGRAFLRFQRYIKSQARSGVLLAVCSLNNPGVARWPFQSRDDMPLSLEDFASFKANWRPKADNIRAIGRELGVDFSEMVFVDNSPEQREEVRCRLPAVAVPELPEDPGGYVRALRRGGWFKAGNSSRQPAETR